MADLGEDNDNGPDLGDAEQVGIAAVRDIYIYQPSPEDITNNMPRTLHHVPEDVVLSEGQGRFVSAKRDQEGVMCIACHLTGTKYKGFEKKPKKNQSDTRREPLPNTHEERVDKISCLAAMNQKAKVPCAKCPICSKNPELMGRIFHNCGVLENMPSIAVGPGKQCEFCEDFIAECVCKCEYCNVAKHANDFTLLPDPWPQHPYPKYPQFSNSVSKHDAKKR